MANFNEELPFDVSNSNYKSQMQTQKKENDKDTNKDKTYNNKLNANNTKSSKQKETLRTKLKSDNIDIADLEELNEQNIRNYRARARRNSAIIITLAIFLVLVVASVAIYITLTQLSDNCFLYVSGANAQYMLDGKEISKFRTPADIQSYRIYRFNAENKLQLKIKDGGKYNIKCEIKVYMGSEQLTNVLIYELNEQYFKRENSNSFISLVPIDGNQTIDLCQGIILDGEYGDKLNIDTFKLEIHTYLEKV